MVRWYVTINLASIKSKRIKLRIKLNHNIVFFLPILNPHFICINIIIFSGVYPIDSIHLQGKAHVESNISQNNNIMYAKFKFSRPFLLDFLSGSRIFLHKEF